jgi:hypothetical protein
VASTGRSPNQLKEFIKRIIYVKQLIEKFKHLELLNTLPRRKKSSSF